MTIRLTDSPTRAKRDRKFGARLVNDLPAPDRGNKIYYNGSPVGFGVRVSDTTAVHLFPVMIDGDFAFRVYQREGAYQR